MDKKNNLFELIKSLSRSEKRYFKLFAARHIIKNKYKETRTANNYVLLFKAIDRQKEYDEKKLKKQLVRSPLIKNFRYNRYHLYNLILKSMNFFHSENTVDREIKDMLQQVDFLFEKELFVQCGQLLNKASLLCYKYERYLLLLEVFRWKFEMMNVASFVGTFQKELQMLFEKETRAIQQYSNINAYNLFAGKMFLEFQKREFVRTKKDLLVYENIMKLQPKEFPESYYAKSFFTGHGVCMNKSEMIFRHRYGIKKKTLNL